jgi:stearoyl-CoA desaturase (Delta-9 desaturase)
MLTFLITLLFTHITIVCVTLFLHRGQAHRGIVFHPILSHFMRLWLWLTTGMNTKVWVAIHRKHHRSTDVEGDPHSPHVYGLWKVLFGGAFLYHKASADHAMIANYGVGTPDDWLERQVYTPHPWLGILTMLIVDLVLFGMWGFLVWGVQMLWIPFWAAGVINGIGHWWGYTNGNSKDHSRNISNFGIIIGGEELHNNHHLEPANPKLSRRWFEFDLGWAWLHLFRFLGLAKLNTRS